MLDVSVLNEQQQRAVTCVDGPILVLAGAGSGKTRVLTYRIAHLIQNLRVPAREILAVTFTNKAAGEMAERVEKLIGPVAQALAVSTFHSTCARILRSEAHLLGYKRDFVIYDSSDTNTLLKRVLSDLGLADSRLSPKLFSRLIDQAKNELQKPSEVEPSLGAGEHFPKVYAEYQSRLKKNNAMDFGDLIYLVAKLFEDDPATLRRYQQRFRYMLIDEYQDTNHAQYRLAQLLAGAETRAGAQGPFVVGDEDQSIYGFRGANISNILNFQKDYPDATVIRLEQNYRSTENILKAANAVVANNQQRLGKNLWSAAGEGQKVRFIESDTEQDEAFRVTEEIRRLRRDGHMYGDVAIFYRMNSLSRPFEERFNKEGIPYQLVGQGFYDRKEIKDARAYLQLLVNPNEEVSLTRVINVPTRGIGAKAEELMWTEAANARVNPWDALDRLEVRGGGSRGIKSLLKFRDLIDGMRRDVPGMQPKAVLKMILERSGYLDRLLAKGSIEDESRRENLNELLTVAAEFDGHVGWDGLQEMLERMALRNSTDENDPEAGRITLMSLHMAKGLEYPVVFLVGMEDGIFPSSRARDEGNLEEERRLCYVGMTRAMKRLYLSRAKRRRHQGSIQVSRPSCFLREVPSDLATGRVGQSGVGSLWNRYKGAQAPAPPSNERRIEPVDDGWSSNLRARSPARPSPSSSWRKPMSPKRPMPGRDPGVSSGPVDTDGPYRDLQVGRNISHPSLGEGRIIARQGPPDNPRLVIRFRDFGEKKIMARMANLELVFGG